MTTSNESKLRSSVATVFTIRDTRVPPPPTWHRGVCLLEDDTDRVGYLPAERAFPEAREQPFGGIRHDARLGACKVGHRERDQAQEGVHINGRGASERMFLKRADVPQRRPGRRCD
jgi:hypothetical protein